MKAAALICAGLVMLTGSACSRRRNTVQAAPLTVPVPATSVAPKRTTAPPRPAVHPSTVKTASAEEHPSIPVLEPLVSPEQRSTWSEEIEARLRQAEQNAASLRGRKLPAMQRDLERVQSFIRQARTAEQAHDYATARSYAERAEILSRDLMKR
jgi:hypothetical protein